MRAAVLAAAVSFCSLSSTPVRALIGLLVVVQRGLVLALAQVEVAKLFMRGSDSLVIIGGGVEIEGGLKLAERLIAFASFEQASPFVQRGCQPGRSAERLEKLRRREQKLREQNSARNSAISWR